MAHIFDRIGGDDTVRAAVDLFYDKILDDPSLVGYFDGVDIPHLRVHQRAFISAALGGPEEYSGPSIRSIHAGLRVTDAAFCAASWIRSSSARMGWLPLRRPRRTSQRPMMTVRRLLKS